MAPSAPCRRRARLRGHRGATSTGGGHASVDPHHPRPPRGRTEPRRKRPPPPPRARRSGARPARWHPSILTTHGLLAAVQSLAGSAHLPVIVRGSVERRLPRAVEANAYFFVAEALTNAVKYAHPSRVDVELRLSAGELSADVAEEGGG